MSMKDYAVDDYGMVLDEETAKTICLKVLKGYDREDYGYDLYNEGLCEHISEFNGEAQELDDDGRVNWGANSDEYRGYSIYYIPLKQYPTIFKKAYNDMGEIVDELKADVGKYLPDDFDYRSRIRHICGTYVG